jgi:hypothetical protein
MEQGGLYKASAAVTDRKKGTQAGLFKGTVPRDLSFCYFNFFSFLMYYFRHCFSCCPSDFTVSEIYGIEAVAALALAVSQSNHSAGSHFSLFYTSGGFRILFANIV